MSNQIFRPVIIDGLLYFADQLVAAWVAQRIPHVREGGFKKYTAIGIMRGGKIAGGVVYHNYRGHDIEFSGVAETPRCATPDTVARLLAYPFLQLGVARVTTITGRRNKRARRFNEGLGFKLEGVGRLALDGKEDAIVYGMLKSECKWLERLKDDGNLRRPAVAPAAA